jgi:hypothetical protein
MGQYFIQLACSESAQSEGLAKKLNFLASPKFRYNIISYLRKLKINLSMSSVGGSGPETINCTDTTAFVGFS